MQNTIWVLTGQTICVFLYCNHELVCRLLSRFAKINKQMNVWSVQPRPLQMNLLFPILHPYLIFFSNKFPLFCILIFFRKCLNTLKTHKFICTSVSLHVLISATVPLNLKGKMNIKVYSSLGMISMVVPRQIIPLNASNFIME